MNETSDDDDDADEVRANGIEDTGEDSAYAMAQDLTAGATHSSPLWPQWAAAWPLVPHSRTLERPTLGSVRSFCAQCNTNVPYIHANDPRTVTC